MTCIARFIALLLLLVVAVPAQAAPPSIPVTACGQSIPASTIGYLTADLDCTGFTGGYDGIAVLVSKRATFDLGGFTLTGGHHGVACIESCDGGQCFASKCTVRNGTVAGAENSGVLAYEVKIEQLTVRDHGDRGVSAHKIKIVGSTIADNAELGVTGGKIDVRGSSITGNGIAGIASGNLDLNVKGRATVKSSTVIGNGTNPECANSTTGCVDIFSASRPSVKKTTCGTSGKTGSGALPNCGGWCVCEGDQP